MSIAAAFQSQRDSTIMDAWRNGGSFDGAPVTDDSVLAYWQKRLSGLSPKDPLYSQYKNNVLQLEYTIAESKARTVYEQTVADDPIGANNKMAQFYMGWLEKFPADSSFYRTLQQSAARFVQAAKSAAKSGSDRAAASSRAAANQATFDKYESAGYYLTNVLTAAAQGMSVIQLDKTLADGLSGGGQYTDAEKLQELIRNINTNPGDYIPNIADANGNRLTGQQLLDQLKALDPSFSGTLTSDYYAQVLRQQVRGQQLRLADAQQNGTKDEANSISKQIEATTEAARQAAVWDTSQLYAEAKREFERVAGSNASPQEKLAAWQKYQSKLISLATDASNPVDDITRGKLLGEAQLDPSTPTFAEAFSGAEAGVDTPKDNAETLANLKYAQDQVQAVQSGQAVWAYGGPSGKDANGDPVGGTIRPGSGQIVAVPWSEVRSSGAQLGVYAQSDGSVVPIYIAPQSVTVRALDQFGNKADTGIVVSKTNSSGAPVSGFQTTGGEVAKVFTYVDGGQKTTIYGYLDGNGVMRYTLDKPWSDGVTETTDPVTGEVKLDVSALVQDAINNGDQTGAVIWKRDANGVPTGEIAGFNPTAIWDKTRALAGTNDYRDFYSLVTATVAAAQGTKVSQIANSPQYQAILEADATQIAQSSQPIINPITGQTLTTAQEKHDEVIAQFNRAVGTQLGYENDAVRIGKAYNPYDRSAAFLALRGESKKEAPPKIATQSGEFSSLSDYLNAQSEAAKPANRFGLVDIKTPTSLTIPTPPPMGPQSAAGPATPANPVEPAPYAGPAPAANPAPAPVPATSTPAYEPGFQGVGKEPVRSYTSGGRVGF